VARGGRGRQRGVGCAQGDAKETNRRATERKRQSQALLSTRIYLVDQQTPRTGKGVLRTLSAKTGRLRTQKQPGKSRDETEKEKHEPGQKAKDETATVRAIVAPPWSLKAPGATRRVRKRELRLQGGENTSAIEQRQKIEV